MDWWTYHGREYARASGEWLRRRARMTLMVGTLVVCVVVYVTFFLEWPFKTREMVILQRRAPEWNTIVFNLDDDYPLSSIEVVALTPEGKRAETIWKLRRGDDARDLSTFAYGQRLRGMDSQVEATPLSDGASYRLIVKASGARGEIDFEYSAGEGGATASRRRRSG
jgi:hypothetical protein